MPMYFFMISVLGIRKYKKSGREVSFLFDKCPIVWFHLIQNYLFGVWFSTFGCIFHRRKIKSYEKLQ